MGFIRLLLVVSVLIATIAYAEPLKVAVVDTGLDRSDPRFAGKLCATGHYNFVDKSENTYDVNGHGTYVAGLIVKYAKSTDYCLIILKFYGEASTDNDRNSVRAIKAAIQDGATIVNLSMGGNEFFEDEYLTIKENPGVQFIAAAGNDGKELNVNTRFYPASYPLSNITPVGAVEVTGARRETSNYGKAVKAWELGVGPMSWLPNGAVGSMTGTSIATAIYTGRYISLRGLRK